MSTSFTTSIAEHGEVARPQRAALRPRPAGIEIDLERGLAAIDLGIEADEAEGGASVARLGLDLARAAVRLERDREPDSCRSARPWRRARRCRPLRFLKVTCTSRAVVS